MEDTTEKNMEIGTQFMCNLIDGPKTVQLPKAVAFFLSLKPYFRNHEKTKTV